MNRKSFDHLFAKKRGGCQNRNLTQHAPRHISANRQDDNTLPYQHASVSLFEMHVTSRVIQVTTQEVENHNKHLILVLDVLSRAALAKHSEIPGLTH